MDHKKMIIVGSGCCNGGFISRLIEEAIEKDVQQFKVVHLDEVSEELTNVSHDAKINDALELIRFPESVAVEIKPNRRSGRRYGKNREWWNR